MDIKIPIRYFVITFLWSWFFWGIIIFAGQRSSQDNMFLEPYITMLIMIVGAFGPAIGAFVSLRTIDGKGAVGKFLKSFVSFNFGWKVWLSIFLVLGGTSVIAWLIPELFGGERLPAYPPSAYVLPIYLLMMIFLGGGQEEIGWRGYISPFLEKRFGLVFGALILGIVWTFWHLPLWFMPGSNQLYMNFFGFMLLSIGYTYFFSWIIEASGNRLMSGLVAHGVANTFPYLFPWLVIAQDAKQERFWIYCILIFVIGVIVVVLRILKKNAKCQ